MKKTTTVFADLSDIDMAKAVIEGLDPRDRTIHAADLFCGAGGFTEGLQEACDDLGLTLNLVAVNHWDTAIATHSTNHPSHRHICASMESLDPRVAVPSGYLDILLASPECTHFSSARGGKPISDQKRAPALLLLRWIEMLDIQMLLVENVPEFSTYGPTYPSDYHIKKLRNRPIPERKGETFRWLQQGIRNHGFTEEHRNLVAADYGGATTRKRFFWNIKKGTGQTIAWPKQTHAKVAGKGLKKWRAAREVIDFSIPSQSIFSRKRPLAPATLNRIFAGLEKHSTNLQPYIIALRNHMDARSIDAPLSTVTAGGQHFGLAEPFLIHLTHGGRVHDINDPMKTVTSAHRGEIGLVEAELSVKGGEYRGNALLLSQQSGGAARSVDEPAMTVATDGAIGLVEAESFIVSAGGPKVSARPVSQPMNTVLTRDHMGVVHMVAKFYGTGISKGIEEPLDAVTTKERFGLVESAIVEYHSEKDGEGARVRSVDETLPTQTTANRFGLADAVLVPMYNEREGQAPRSHSVDHPVPTVPATGDGKFGVAEAEAFIVPHRTWSEGAIDSIERPLRTITAAAGRNFGLVQPVIFEHPDGTRVLLDIRFRMLQPPELAAAMDFRPDYVFKGKIVTKGKFKGNIRKEDVVKQIGNAVDVRQAKALCRTAILDLLQPRLARRVKAA
jgi:DNA (cytosine-5)-methyltransferase 1